MIVAIMTTALSGTAAAQTSWSHEFVSPEAVSNGSITVNNATWSVSTVTKAGSPTIDKGNSYSKYCLKFGSGKSNCYSSVTFSTDYFNNYNVQSVSVQVLHNASKSGTFTATQGNTTIGTVTQTIGTSWTDLTVNTSAGSGGTLSFTYSPTDCAVNIHSITVTYTTGGSSAVATTTTIDDSGITNTDVYTGTAAGSLAATVKDANNNVISAAAVTWSSSDEDVATVAADGTVTLVAAGTTNITASYAGVANQYLSSTSDVYELTVTDSTPFVGGDVTFDATKDKGTSPLVKNGVTFACTSGVLDNGSEYRLYKNSVTTFSVSEGTITQIAFTGTSSNPASGFETQTGWTTDGNDGTWIGNASSVSFTASGAQVRATEIVVTVDMSATPDPVINADNVSIDYADEEGQIAYTISNPISGGSIVASSTSDWLEVDNAAKTASTGTIDFICNPNPAGTQRTAVVTLTYTYNNNETVTKNVTVTQAGAPVIYTTIPALFAKATEVGSTATDVLVTFDSWVVSGVSTNGKNVFVTDNSGNGFVIYYGSDMSSTFAAGKILSGTAVSCKVQLYNGFAEVTNLDASNLTITDGGTVSTANIALADLSGVHTGALVSYDDLTCSVSDSKYYLSDGTTTLQVYNALYAFGALEAGKTYNITGIYQQYSGTKEILPRSAADIVEVQAQHSEYTLTVSTLTNVEMFVFDAANQSSALIDGEGSAQVYDGTQVLISVSAEAGYELESLIVDGNDVTSEIVSDAYTFTMPTHAVTVTATAVAVIPPTSASGKYVKVTSTADITDGGQYLIVCEDANVALNGDLETLDAISNTIGVTISGNEIVATSATVAAEFTIAVIDGGYSVCSAKGEYIYHTGSKNTLNTSDEAHANSISFDEGNVLITVGSYNLKYNATSGQTRFRYFTTDQTAIQLYKKVESVTVTSAGYATYCSEKALDFTDTDIKAYVGTKNGDKLTFTSIDQVPAGTGLLLVYEGGKTENVPVIASATAVEGNCLVGVNAETTINSTDYILNKVNDGVGFYKAGSYTTLGAHKAYIPAAVGGNVKGFTIDFDDDATGISLMEDGRSQMEDGVIYNLAGQRISKMQKGINIVNGKKILK